MAHTNPYHLSVGAGRVVSINASDLEIYSGEYWRVSHTFSGVSDAATVNLQIKTSDDLVFLTKRIIRIANGDWSLKIIEAPTVTDGTSAVSTINLNRNSTKTNSVSVFSDPSSISGGTTLTDEDFYDVGPARTGSLTNETLNWIFKANTDYIFQFTNNSGSASDINIVLEFKEYQDLT